MGCLSVSLSSPPSLEFLGRGFVRQASEHEVVEPGLDALFANFAYTEDEFNRESRERESRLIGAKLNSNELIRIESSAVDGNPHINVLRHVPTPPPKTEFNSVLKL